MTVSETSLPGVRLIEPDVHTDDRGSFAELWNVRDYGHHGLEAAFVKTTCPGPAKGCCGGCTSKTPGRRES